jgi:tRNA threonylcarbamoyladenosine biosynthesis protein TsaE
LIKIKIKNLSGLPRAASQILEEAEGNRIFLFYAEMAMGKTTLIKELCKQLGVEDNVSSPTFSIVNEYAGKQEKIYHFDFYRIKDEQEAFDLGYEEYFYSGNYCFVEWPEKIENLLPENAVSISITGNSEGERMIELHLPI